MSSDIVLATLNAKYVHTSFGLRYLYANLGALRARATIVELDINQDPLEIVEALLAGRPKILGVSVYIWNATKLCSVLAMVRRLAPQTILVLGGPEISFETETHPLTALADYVICGEADLAFGELCAALLDGEEGGGVADKIRRPPLPDLSTLVLPYDDYDDRDLAHRVIYVEASRGCPYQCEFCLSSLDERVRSFPLEPFLAAMVRLFERGVRHFKFVDRTFNLHIDKARRILELFLALEERAPGELFVHFELIPDRLPPSLREVIARFRPGALQFEIGVQTLSPVVEQNVSRRQDHERLAENFRFLRRQTGAHLHADLIVGLPGETPESFAASFDRLLALEPHEIQVGMLKRLRGTPIARHDGLHQMVYAPDPPYEILRTGTIDFATMQALRRFAKYWDLYFNSGRFVGAMRLLLEGGSAFAQFLSFAGWLHEQVGRTHGIALQRQIALIARYLHEVRGMDVPRVRDTLVDDYQRSGGRDALPWLFPMADSNALPTSAGRREGRGTKRQDRHRGRGSEGP